MAEALYIVSNVVRIIIMVLQLALFIRMLFSWLPIEPNGFTEFIYAITEPFIYPFRALFVRLNWFQDMPIDMAFTATWLVLFILSIIL